MIECIASRNESWFHRLRGVAGWRRVAGTALEATGEERERVWKIVSDDGAYLGYEKMAYPRVIPVFVLSA